MIKGSSLYFGIIGDPVKHSASPFLHNEGFKLHNLDFFYHAIHADYKDLKLVTDALKLLNYKGFNVTVPFKEKIIPLLDKVHPCAKSMEAVNTVINNKGSLEGYNTDGLGFQLFLKEEKIKIKNKKICILGAGGSAKAIAKTLVNSDISKLSVVNRSLENAYNLTRLLKINNQKSEIETITFNDSNFYKTLSQSDIIIQTTPIGMTPNSNASLINSDEVFNENQTLIDIIYSPKKTKLMKLASQKNCKVHNGLGMLAGQGVLCFKLFTQKSIAYQFYKNILTTCL